MKRPDHLSVHVRGLANHERKLGAEVMMAQGKYYVADIVGERVKLVRVKDEPQGEVEK